MTQKEWAIMGLAIVVGIILFALGDPSSENAILKFIGKSRDHGGDVLVLAGTWVMGSFCLGKIFGGKKTDGQDND